MTNRLLFLSSLVVLVAWPARAQTGTCPVVSSISVQPGFDYDSFANESRWNVVLYNKIIPIEGLDMQVVKSDVSLMFSRDADNNKTVTLAGRVRLASSFAFCLKLQGSVEDSAEIPAKLRQSFYNPLTNQFLDFNFWILHTDYTNLAVVYACEKIMAADGTCDPGSSYMWTLSRGTSHTAAERERIQEIFQSVCLDMTSLRQIEHSDVCPMT
ncbi:retinol-binding protein 4-B-like [Crassostrea angulata]|uniref:retinol-binding protein 4-B-like n=1 Tax=Magallana angulata TaxID=2784310 RepID=UPI0022B0C58C|nr:retinol-binding protein 4-B-like [Crassostrea angulata]